MLDAIRNRRSIRKYTSEPVTEQEIQTLLESAMLAPSAVNGQPWHFVVIDDRAILDQLREAHPYAGMLASAPLCIAVCGEEKYNVPGYWQQDCAAATENLLLAAVTMGLGSCWMGVAPRADRMEAVRRVLDLPGHIQPFNLIAVGHPDETRPTPERYEASKVHWNRW